MYTFILTVRLTQDALENLFSQIRERGDNHPSPVRFRHNLRLIGIAQYMRIPNNTSYAVDDSYFEMPFCWKRSQLNIQYSAGEVIEEIMKISDDCNEDSVIIDDHLIGLAVQPSDSKNGLNKCEQNALYYLDGWIGFKVKNQLKSGVFLSWLMTLQSPKLSLHTSTLTVVLTLLD